MLKVNEIFYSIQGESTYAGLPCVFIRLTACNLRCSYCDTTYAYHQGTELSLAEIMAQVNEHSCNLVEITGGEPLLQSGTTILAKMLIKDGKTVLVETNGSLDISSLEQPVIRIMDIKCPGSGESEHINWDNLLQLRQEDNVKFVITNKDDFQWAVEVVRKFGLIHKTQVLFSPAFNILDPLYLAQWLLEASMPIRLQLQLHKYIWDPEKRGV